MASSKDSRSSITYTYSNCHISHFAARKIDFSCKLRDPNKTTNIGVFCKTCPYFNSLHYYRGSHYVLCTHPKAENEGHFSKEAHAEFCEVLQRNAITHYYD